MSFKTRTITVTTRLLLLALIMTLAACNKSEKSSFRVFASPDEAGNGLQDAVKSGDQNAILAIFGKESKDTISSGDAVQDKAAADQFVAAYSTMHRWRKMEDGSQVLVVGADNFPFPIPLKTNSDGKWFFDAAAGKAEILARRIGRNELAVIDICEGLVDAQAEYFSQRHEGSDTQQFAPKFISDSGKQNGLYWESQAGQPQSPLGPLVAFATTEGYTAKANPHEPFHGYFFRMLDRQGASAQGGARDFVVGGKMVGGFAFIAFPAEYRNSGVMTFMVGTDGTVYQKDLGEKTSDIATAMTEYNPDGWTNALEEEATE
jgi:Protein of unknown function (DUF2950)